MARFVKFLSAELVKFCAGSKDEAAWTELIGRSHPVIAAAALRTARHWGEPSRSQLDDLIQDTYLKLCEDDRRLLRSFQPRHQNSFFGFLRVVAINVVHDHFKAVKAIKRGADQTGPLAEPDHEVGPRLGESDSFTTVNQHLQIERIDKALRQLTAGRDQERKCMVFWLRHRHGMTASEIAAIPAIALTTEGVESMLMRLTALIRAHFMGSISHREVKVLPRKNRSKRAGS
jgi:RNA polymerase sigma-70 factor (ECF subfamily)